MTVSVRLLGPLGRLAGARETSVDVTDGTTIVDVLATLATRYGPAFAAAVFRAPREVHTYVRVFVDEQEISVDHAVGRAGGPPAQLAVLAILGFEGGI